MYLFPITVIESFDSTKMIIWLVPPEAKFTSGWDFFGIPNPKSRKSRNSGDRDLKFRKIPSEKSRKSRNLGDCYRYIKTSNKSRKNPEWNIPKILGMGIWIWKSRKHPVKITKKSRVKIPRIRDFFGIFYLRDIQGIFYPQVRDFFVGWDIQTNSHFCSRILFLSWKQKLLFNYKYWFHILTSSVKIPSCYDKKEK